MMRFSCSCAAVLACFVTTFIIGYVAGHWADSWRAAFVSLFFLRYTRFFGHILGYWTYRPSPVNPQGHGKDDVTVVLPTVNPHDPGFQECVQTILNNEPSALLVVTVGTELHQQCDKALCGLSETGSRTQVTVSSVPKASKRRQIAHAMPHVKTKITVLVDDHVFWPNYEFLSHLCAPFDDGKNVGAVTTCERVRRTTPGELSWASLVNFIACNYLERHNWELQASNALDGGVFVIPGPTCAFLTSFLADEERMRRFCTERFFFGLLGSDGLNADDDNFLTREVTRAGLKICYQDTTDPTDPQQVLMETTLGEWPKFHKQLLRWSRTTFRSNPALLQDGDFLKRYLWSYFMVYLASLLNFAIFWDSMLIASLAMSNLGGFAIFLLVVWLVFTKTIKLIPHLRRHPKDIWLMPFQIIFGYYHSVIKFWAMVTFWDCAWSGRSLDQLGEQGNTEEMGIDSVSEQSYPDKE